MADNLNVSNSTGGEQNPPINNVPTQSPLEQSGLNQAPSQATNIPAEPGMPVSTPPQQMPGGDLATQSAVNAGGPNEMPPASPADLGESAPAPDTDEFLKSILQEQPQPQTPASEPLAPLDNTAPTGNMPLQEQSAPASIPEATPVDLNEKPLDQVMPSEPKLDSTMPAQPAESLPPLTSPQEPKLADNVPVDTFASNSAPAQPSEPGMPPEPPLPNQPSSNPDPMLAPPQPGGSMIKKIIIIVLALIVLAGGYYAYTTLFAGGIATNSSPSSATQESAPVDNTSQDSQRKSDLLQIKQALLNYSAGSGGQYPISVTFIYLNQPGNILEKELVPVYLSKLPEDPKASKAYAYKSDGLTFTLSAELDDANDPEGVMDSGKVLYQVTSSASASPSTTTPEGSTGSAIDNAQTGTTGSTNTAPLVPGSPN